MVIDCIFVVFLVVYLPGDCLEEIQEYVTEDSFSDSNDDYTK